LSIWTDLRGGKYQSGRSLQIAFELRCLDPTLNRGAFSAVFGLDPLIHVIADSNPNAL
jgi:hypothetical protein